MENIGQVYLVDNFGKIRHQYESYNDFEIIGKKLCHGKYIVLKNAKQICLLHTGEQMHIFNLPYAFVSMKGVYLSNNKMFYHITTKKNELFLDNDLNVICECDRINGIKSYRVIYKNDYLNANYEFDDNNIPFLVVMGNSSQIALIIDLVNRKNVIKGGRIEKYFNGCYYIDDNNGFGYLYNINNGGVLKSLGKQRYVEKEKNITRDTFEDIEIDGKKYYSYKDTESRLRLLDENLDEVNIDTKDISFVRDTKYLKYHPKNRYICVDINGKYQIYEFGKTEIKPIGEKYEDLTWYISAKYLMTRKPDSRYDAPYRFVSWNGEYIDDIAGNVDSEIERTDGKIQLIIKSYKTDDEDKKYAGYYFYDDKFHIATDYYANIRKEDDSVGNSYHYRCETFDGNVIYLDADFNDESAVNDTIEKQTKYTDVTIVENVKTHETIVKNWLYSNTYITAEIPNNYLEIIIPKWVRHNSGNRGLIVRTKDEKYILYNSVDSNDYVKLCEMDNIAYGGEENQYYVCNKNEEYPVRLVKITKDNKLTVNRHKLKSIFIETGYPKNEYYFDGNEVGMVRFIKNKYEFDTDLYDYWWRKPNEETLEKMKDVEPDIYFLDKDDNITKKREDI